VPIDFLSLLKVPPKLPNSIAGNLLNSIDPAVADDGWKENRFQFLIKWLYVHSVAVRRAEKLRLAVWKEEIPKKS
jgi:hypothetical protein